MKAWAKAHPDNQEQLAKRLGCSKSFLSLVLSGKRNPGLDLVLAIERETTTWRRGPIKPSEWPTHKRVAA